jgi:rare lipoprotein A
LISSLLVVAACAAPTPEPLPPSQNITVEQPTFRQVGKASWYGKQHHGRTTANGEVFDMEAMTAAHRSLPFDTVVRVINVANGKSIKVRINDRGPYGRGRIIDLSAKAARALGIVDDGTAEVRIEAYASDQVASEAVK